VTAAGLAALVERVGADGDLHRRLVAVREHRSFVAEVVAVAAELGLEVEPGDVDRALRAAREWWLMRWV
jgi:hypothetical protein